MARKDVCEKWENKIKVEENFGNLSSDSKFKKFKKESANIPYQQQQQQQQQGGQSHQPASNLIYINAIVLLMPKRPHLHASQSQNYMLAIFIIKFPSLRILLNK